MITPYRSIAKRSLGRDTERPASAHDSCRADAGLLFVEWCYFFGELGLLAGLLPGLLVIALPLSRASSRRLRPIAGDSTAGPQECSVLYTHPYTCM